MMEYCLEELDLEPLEYCFLSEDTPVGATTFRMTIPKLMPFIGGEPRVIPAGVNKGFLINDNACKPSIPTTLPTQNFVTIPKIHYASFMYKSLKWDDTYIIKGQKFLAHIINQDIRVRYLSDLI